MRIKFLDTTDFEEVECYEFYKQIKNNKYLSRERKKEALKDAYRYMVNSNEYCKAQKFKDIVRGITVDEYEYRMKKEVKNVNKNLIENKIKSKLKYEG